MPVSATRRLKEALLRVIRNLASIYGIVLQLNRDSDDAVFKSAFRRLSLKVHPDKGGTAAHQQQLNDAFQAWQKANSPAGRPRQGAQAASSSATGLAAGPQAKAKQRSAFRVQGLAVMLTYQGFPGIAAWESFVSWWSANHKALGVKYWCATLETNTRGNQGSHAHVMVLFCKEVDVTTHAFRFQEKKPRADANDLLGEGWGGRRYQKSVDRGFFYVWADKVIWPYFKIRYPDKSN